MLHKARNLHDLDVRARLAELGFPWIGPTRHHVWQFESERLENERRQAETIEIEVAA